VTVFIANARMYAVAPEAEAAWRELVRCVASDAGVALEYLPYPAPRPLEDLWTRSDLGAVQMCGYPIATRMSDVVPIAAPIPAVAWAQGRAVYRTDMIVKMDSPFQTLADTFGKRAGWTVEHSHSGFNAFRHHLLRYRNDTRPALYGEVIGHLVTARRILDSVLADDIDVGPLDAYWHMLLRKYRPDLTKGLRVVESTDLSPMPAFVASRGLGDDAASNLRRAFLNAESRPWFAPLADALLIEGFAAICVDDYAPTLAWEARAKVARYPVPA
jgi:ABC-type phosphate/phosphonate transport system substrate-binding protein